MSVVLDSSVALAWLLPDEQDDRADAVLDEVLADGGVISPLFELEVGNILVVKQRRKDLTAAQVSQAIDLLFSLPLEPLEVDLDLRQVVSLAQAHGLASYDASYLNTAVVLDLPLATLDEKLRAAAVAEGVTLFA